MKKALLLIKNQRGIAMIVAIFAMVLSVVIATEVAYETQVGYVGASQSISRLKAYYAAKAGVELSLYRILLYKKAQAQFGDQLKDKKALLDQIWQFPFSWPPMGLELMNEVDKDQVQTIIKESTMDAQFAVTIEGEGGKIDINDLGSEVEALSKAVRVQLLQIFDNEIQNNKKFKEKYSNYDFDKLINNIQDYVDEDTVSKNSNGSESVQYKQPESARNFQLPPNTAFKTVNELHSVLAMEDVFFDLLKNRITVYGTKGININTAPEEVLKSLDPQIKDDRLKEVIARRTSDELGGPFRDEDDFYNFLESKGVRTANLKKLELPLIFDAEYNFCILSSGLYSNVVREITVITYDVDNLSTRYAGFLNKSDEEKGGAGTNPGGGSGGAGGTTPPDKKKSEFKAPKGRPNVVFWQES